MRPARVKFLSCNAERLALAIQSRSHPSSHNQNEQDLLQVLLEAPPAPRDERRSVIVLRSVEEQREYALRGFLRRTWVDGALHHAERLLILAALLIFGVWFADGPLRDWLHERANGNRVAVAAPNTRAALPSATLIQPTTTADQAALLPFVTDDMAIEQPSDDFLAPRQPAPVEPVIVVREPSRLLIPVIELDTPVKEVFVVDGVWEVADYAAGYMNGTALPGDNGNTVLAGHAGLRGAVFRDLGRLATGDEIFLDAGGWRYHYRVREITSVWPDQIEVLESRGEPVITLITCVNWDTQRLIVVADLLDSTPTPGE